MPIVIIETDAGCEIVDGFHRYTLGLKDREVRAISGGMVPTVSLEAKDESIRMMATIRHNRARGKHGILAMANIVQRMKALGLSDEEIQFRVGMEQEEIDRLSTIQNSPMDAGRDSFGKGWVPK